MIRTKHQTTNKVSTLFLLVIFSILLIGSLFIGFGVMELHAGSSHNVSGWAWSDNMGWISFNCTNTATCPTVDYGVNVDETGGNLSGYAWSDNVGWISFNESELSGCPQGECKAWIDGGKLLGWAKALSGGIVEAGGWDGWISLGCDEAGVCSDSNYGVTLDGNEFEGFVWDASDVSGDAIGTGWITFNYAFIVPPGGGGGGGGGGVFLNADTPSVSLSASKMFVSEGENTELFWTSSNVDSCVAEDGTVDWPGSKATTDSQVVGPIIIDTTYTLVCSGVYGSVSDSITISVLSDSDKDFSLTKSDDFSITFVGGGSGDSNAITVNVVPQLGFSDDVILSASPSPISGVPVTYNFSDPTLSSDEYSVGSPLFLSMPDSIAPGVYMITVLGEGDGLVRWVTINLNVDSTGPTFEEF